MKPRRRMVNVPTVWLAAACGSSDSDPNRNAMRADAEPFDASYQDGAAAPFDSGIPGTLVYNAGGKNKPSRIFMTDLQHTPYPASRALTAPATGFDEMPAFDAMGARIVYVHDDGGARTIRSVTFEGTDPRLVATCAGACEHPQLAVDGTTWFVDRPAGGPERVMRVPSGGSSADPWSVDVSGCFIRSMRLSLERDRIVLSLENRTGLDGGADAEADGGTPCSTTGIVVLPLGGATAVPGVALPPIAFDGESHPLEIVTAATASSVTGDLFAIAYIADRTNPIVVQARASGELITSYGGRDAFDVIRPNAPGVPASFIMREHSIDEQFDIQLVRYKGVSTTLVSSVTPPNFIGTLSWTPRMP